MWPEHWTGHQERQGLVSGLVTLSLGSFASFLWASVSPYEVSWPPRVQSALPLYGFSGMSV